MAGIYKQGVFAIMLGALAACAQVPQTSHVSACKPEYKITDEQPRVPDEYLVTLSPEADQALITEYFERYGIRDLYVLSGETYLLIVRNDPGPLRMMALVDEDDHFLAVQPNLVYWDKRTNSLAKQ